MIGCAQIVCALAMFMAVTANAQLLDSLAATAGRPGQSTEQRVRIWTNLLRIRSVTADEALQLPGVAAVLQDTSAGDGWAWMLSGSLNERGGAFARAADHYVQAETVFKEAGNESAQALAALGLASVRSLKGDQTMAMRGLFDALAVLQRTGPIADEAQALLSLAYIYRYQENYDKSLEHYRRVGDIARNTGDPILRVESLRGEAGVLVEQRQLAEAGSMYAEALKICEDIGQERRAAIIHVELANIKLLSAELNGARQEFKDALRLFEQHRNDVWTSYTLSRLAEVHHRMGDNAEAFALADRGYSLARERGLMKEMLDNLLILPEVSASLGRYEEALDYSLAFETLNDSMRNDATSTELARLDMQQEQVRDSLVRAELRAREQIIFEANVAKARTQRNIYLFLGSGVLVLAGGLWARLRHARRIGSELAAGNALIVQEVERAQRSERVKEQFLANMSHEIRTPMNAIMGMTAILRRNERLPEQERYLDAIAQSSGNLLVILNDVLDLGKLEAGTVELDEIPMDPRVVLGNVLDMLRFKAEEKGLKLEMCCEADVPHLVVGDPTRLNQVLLNLVGNAVKFTERGGVTVEVSRVYGSAGGDGVVSSSVVMRYAVRDTGIGIRKERINEIFEEFTQAYSDTTRKYGGTGLGLTITKRLVELQGGTVRVESVPDQGSTFIVEIPCGIVAGRIGADVKVPTAAGPGLGGIRILLAEDNEFNLLVAQDELQDAIPGVRIDVARNGRMAVEMAASGGYDVVLMDIQMPELNGIEATMAIRDLPGDAGKVPIIAMTANVLKSEVDRCMAAGMNAFVPKPFEREDLLGKLAVALNDRPRGS